MARHGAADERGCDSQGDEPDSLFDGHGRGLLIQCRRLAIPAEISRLEAGHTKQAGGGERRRKRSGNRTLPHRPRRMVSDFPSVYTKRRMRRFAPVRTLNEEIRKIVLLQLPRPLLKED